jgi:hypothetical protein
MRPFLFGCQLVVVALYITTGTTASATSLPQPHTYLDPFSATSCILFRSDLQASNLFDNVFDFRKLLHHHLLSRTMAEALVIVGLVSSIVQFVDYSSKVVERLGEFQSNLDEVPKTFKDIKTELPLLINTLKRTEDQVRAGDVSQDTQDALFLVVEGCRDQLKILDDILFKTLPKVGDSSLKRGRRPFRA